MWMKVKLPNFVWTWSESDDSYVKINKKFSFSQKNQAKLIINKNFKKKDEIERLINKRFGNPTN